METIRDKAGLGCFVDLTGVIRSAAGDEFVSATGRALVTEAL